MWAGWELGRGRGETGIGKGKKTTFFHYLLVYQNFLGCWHLISNYSRSEFLVNPENTVCWWSPFSVKTITDFFFPFFSHDIDFYQGVKSWAHLRNHNAAITLGPSCVMLSLCSTCWENALNNPVFWHPEIYNKKQYFLLQWVISALLFKMFSSYTQVLS